MLRSHFMNASLQEILLCLQSQITEILWNLSEVYTQFHGRYYIAPV